VIPLAWLILWTPFFSAVGIFFFLLHRPQAAGWIATAAMAFSFFFSLLLLFRAGIPREAVESSVQWVALPALKIEFGILLNGLTLLMLLIVTGVGSLIFLYSQGYMHRDPGYSRYFASLSLFAFSMLGIVLANNLVELFAFWELVGLSSYLLIGHWFEKPEAADAGKKAFLTTRVGDVGFLLGILLLFGWLQAGGEGTFNFLVIQDLVKGIHQAGNGGAVSLLTAAGILIFLGVAGKSAQFPLHVWLPDAMEGPTPVSALIHAVQTDIKRILAYSTISQLGFMVAGLGLGNPQAGMFHLATHAFFKALLFLGAGSVIHTLHTQDIRQMSGLLKKMPVTGGTFFVGTLALVGIFPLSGFWSKEEILATAQQTSPIAFLLLLATAFLTAVYMGRLFAIVFLGEAPKKAVHDPGWEMNSPLVILALFSILAGFLPLKEFVPIEHEGSGPFWVTLLGLAVGTVGFVLSLYLYLLNPALVDSLSENLKGPRRILERKYYVDDFYNALIRHVQDGFAHLCDLFERVVVVEWGVNGTARLVRFTGHLLRQLQTGRIQFYALIVSLGVTLLTYGWVLWNR